MSNKQVSRRQFVSAVATAVPVSSQFLARAARTQVNDAIPSKAQPFDLKHVRLRDGPFKEATERTRRFLHDLEADRLLHMFRVTAGLPSPGEPLGGWERPDVELRGHFTGHYLSACALMNASTGDDALKTKGDAMVAELAKCQAAHRNGYLSAFPEEFFDRLKAGKKVWAPWYTLHKIMAGLLEMHVHCGNEQALDVLQGMAGWTQKWADTLSEEHMARVLETEYGGMNEMLYNLYAVTGNASYSKLAHRFDHKRIFDPLAEGRDELKGLHVNTTIPKIIGAARRYELTGEERYHDIADFFWRQVTGQRSYCTGGTSNFEHWRTEPGKLAGELSERTQECCCTYNMLKLTRRLFAWTAEPACADYYERALFNGILGTQNPADGMMMYFVPLASGYWKLFNLPRKSFWCCTGTGIESFSKLADSIYFHDERGLFVNLFIPSQLEWPERHLRVVQETNFPERPGTTLVVQADRPTSLALRVRVPYWATRGVTVKVNGKRVKSAARPSSYITLTRTWKSGDKVEISTPMSLHMHPMPDDMTVQALMWGPVVLAGQLGAGHLTKEMLYGDPQGGHILKGEPAVAPALKTDSTDPSTWIKPVSGQRMAFRTTGQSQDLTLIPLYRLFGQRYAVYWRITGDRV